ncbi:MAG: hypothetical protein B7X08_00175 [Acidocella sp. 20-63-7]|nr:MAG: hypothetical protein B7X08_00175 [Acidocella sp. 20-63-7]HQT45637.1 5-demethoxyubiquinol-8 5-hydroxylase UbiM [Acidocella sp.]
MATRSTSHDVIITGAGPAGLSLAASLAAHGLDIGLIERQPESTLAEPEFDGREIALTHHSIKLLSALGAWPHIPEAEISPLGEAQVRNGASTHALRFNPHSMQAPLGQLVPNHQIRRALFAAVRPLANIHLRAATAATGIATDQDSATLTLASGERLSAQLIVAADTRFSEMRRRMGITARMRDFGKTMMVCRMSHEQSHQNIATEWFGFGQTIAILPLNGTPEKPHISSLVLTLPACHAERLMNLDPEAFSAEMTQRYERRLGDMRLLSTRHAYPLVGVYAGRFTAKRFALVGDAAVGMHPVTAHGFNFGLSGQKTLATLIGKATVAGQNIASPTLLKTYESQHRRATLPLYLATNATALLYTDDRRPARILRDAVIRTGEQIPLLRHAITAGLMAGGR